MSPPKTTYEALVFIVVIGLINVIAVSLFFWSPRKFYRGMSVMSIFLWTAFWGAGAYFESFEYARYFEVQIIVEDTGMPYYVRDMEKVFRDFIFGYMESYSRWGDRQELVHSSGRPRSRHASSSMAMTTSSSVTFRTSQSSGSLPRSARDEQPSGYSFYRPKNFYKDYCKFVTKANVVAKIPNEEEPEPNP
nr:hypothetical protein Iba_chr12bCG4920 [Ipomoea batatas]